jgi:hypothetical protein
MNGKSYGTKGRGSEFGVRRKKKKGEMYGAEGREHGAKDRGHGAWEKFRVQSSEFRLRRKEKSGKGI